MKTFIKIFAIGFALAFSSIANAAVMNIVSGDGNVGETCQELTVPGTVGSCVVIEEHNAWQDKNPLGNGAEWISYADTGIGGAILGNSNSEARMSVVETITVGATNVFLSFTVWADDTASVWIDGNEVYAANIGQDGACAGPQPIGCESDEGQLIEYMFTSAGDFDVRIDAYQLGGSVFGVLYSGTLTTVPEPGILGFLGLGLLGMGIARRRRG